MIEQILSYKTLFFDVVTAIGYAMPPAMNKNLHAPLVKICTSGGDPQSHGNLISNEYWRESSISTAKSPTSASNFVGQHNKIGDINFGATLVKLANKKTEKYFFGADQNIWSASVV